MTFQTDFNYIDRETKAKYVWLKYKPILENSSILDVGADECYLKEYLPSGATYLGIGLGGNPDQQINLEKEKIPFDEDSFDTVLCLDVLEHVENIHDVFDELCRVSRHYVIISLPNAWADFYAMLRFREYKPGQATKFYGLPLEIPADRHKWFFSAKEAENFVQYRAEKNDMNILQLDYHSIYEETGNRLEKIFRNLARKLLFRQDLIPDDLYLGTLWIILEKCT